MLHSACCLDVTRKLGKGLSSLFHDTPSPPDVTAGMTRVAEGTGFVNRRVITIAGSNPAASTTLKAPDESPAGDETVMSDMLGELSMSLS